MLARVVHVTAHMGGGVGRVLRHFTAASQRSGPFLHEIYCLDYANAASVDWSRAAGIPVWGDMARDFATLAEAIHAADIVHIHWWNHPLIGAFLNCDDVPPQRTALWAHVSGHHAPHAFRDDLLDYADRFVLATPCSRQAPVLDSQSADWRDRHLRTVFASAGFDHVADVQPYAHQGFRVGYIGTVDYAKMHRDFLAMHAAARIPGMQVVVCGGAREQDLRAEAKGAGWESRFDIRGPVREIGSVLASLDVFGYPLAERHYGASEMALVEAMAAGVVPVVWNNACEREIVNHGRTGLVARTASEYTAALETLYEDGELRQRLAAAARQVARERFGIEHTVHRWHAIYDELRELPKRPHSLAGDTARMSRHGRGTRLFLQSLQGTPEGRIFTHVLDGNCDRDVLARLSALEPVFHGTSNGSVRQYQRFFPDDPGLTRLAAALDSSRRAPSVVAHLPGFASSIPVTQG